MDSPESRHARAFLYEDVLADQEGACAICRSVQPGKRLAVDHCHRTGAFRALLCTNCNVGLGMFRDDPALLRRAAAYLEEHHSAGPLPPPQPPREPPQPSEEERFREAHRSHSIGSRL